MKRIVVPTGYMGSGSSAITAIVSEFNHYCGKSKTQEFVFLHCPNGVFDLEDKLLMGNNIFISDEYLAMFRSRMKDLYDLKFWWPGSYKKYIGKDFMNFVDEYIADLVDYKNDQFWYMNELPKGLFMKSQKFIQVLGKKFFKKYFNYLVLNRRGVQFAYPSKEKFYQASRVFIEKILNEMSVDDNIILDQFLLPHNLFRVENYFVSGELKVFVVDRDPRDVFLQNKYFYAQRHEQIPFPTKVEDFCDFYRQIRQMEKIKDTNDILRIHFEDLIYCYEDSLQLIYKHLGISSKGHQKKGEIFKPEESINNTQIFNSDARFVEEGKYIERHLKEFIYDFPEKRISKIEDISFD